MKKLLLPLMITAALAGCASFPDNYDKNMTMPEVVNNMPDGWNQLPPLTYRPSKTGVVVRKFNEIPLEVAKRPLDFTLKPGEAFTLDDVLYSLRVQGIRVVSRLGTETAAKPWLTYSFKGTLGEFVEELTLTENVSFEYRNGVIFLTESSRYASALPQHKEYMAQITDALKAMGGTDVRGDVASGTVYYAAKPDVADYLKDYLAKIASNSAMINLQVAVLTVGLHKDKNLGFDWSTLAVQTGRRGMAPGVTGGSGTSMGNLDPVATTGTGIGIGTGTGTGTGAGTGTGTGTGGAVAEAAKVALGSMLGFSGAEGFAYRFRNDTFSLTAAIKALSTYGNARTEQNVILSTLSGMPVEIKSGNDIPYVKSIGSATASGGSTTGSATTEIIQSGLKVEITPNFDAVEGAVVTEVAVELSSLVGFRELPAGMNLGTLSQPEMQKLEFKNVGSILTGETVIMGGITYDQLTNNYNNLPGMETLPTGSSAEKVSRNAIYIVLRPTVVIADSRVGADVMPATVGSPLSAAAVPVEAGGTK